MYPSALPWQLKAPCQSVMTAKAGTGHWGRLWNLQHRAEEGTNMSQSGFGMLILPLVWRGYYSISWGPFQPSFSEAESETVQCDFGCEDKSDPPSPSGCWTAVLKQHPFLSSPALLLLPTVPSSTALTWPATLWHIPCSIFPSKNLPFFHAVFIFIWETSVKLKILRNGINKEIFETLNFWGSGNRESALHKRST